LAPLLSSIAAILNAIAWPGVTAWFLFVHRAGISHLLKILGSKLSSAKKLKIGQLELEEELEEGVSDVREQITDADVPRVVPENQLKAAVDLKEKARSAQLPRITVLETVKRQIYDLASEYERVRDEMPSGHMRTRKMNEIAAGMRTLALAGLPLRTQLAKSDSVGRRLASICMLQVAPRARYFNWLIERIKCEDHPFVFYQAAVAILELVKKGLYTNSDEVRSAIDDAIHIITAFRSGQPDQNTLDVLNEALSLVR